jgi:hypothetical protein
MLTLGYVFTGMILCVLFQELVFQLVTIFCAGW